MPFDKIRKAIKLIIFFALCAFLFIQLSYQFRDELANTKGNLSGFYAQEKNTLDVVVVGTSATFSAFGPMDAWEQRGFTSYNFCTNVLLENSIKYAVREIEKTQSPKVIVIDIAPFIFEHYTDINSSEFDEQWVRYNIDGYRYSWNRIQLINHVVPKDIPKGDYYWDIAKYHSNREPDLGEYWFMKKDNVNKGYNNLPWKGEQILLLGEKTQDVCSLEGVQNELFLDLLESLGKCKSEILFINQPLVYQTEEQIMHVNYMKEKIKEKGYDFLDMSDFYDEIGIF